MPASVQTTCDESGRGHLDLPLPLGRGSLRLLVSARWQGHERTRILEVERTQRREIDLRVSDTNVVPGGKVSAWVVLRDRVTGRPAGNTAVDLALKEGAAAHFSRRLVTDQAGMVSTESPFHSWRIPNGSGSFRRARHWAMATKQRPPSTSAFARKRRSRPRCVSVGKPKPRPPGQRRCSWSKPATARAWDWPSCPCATGFGQRGHQPPKEDKAWLASSIALRSDDEGVAKVTVDTPRTISPRGSSLTVVAKTEVEGRRLTDQATLTLATPVPELEIVPEAGVLLPGQPQHLFLHATLDGKPLAADIALTGHGLDARVHINPRGWGEVVWMFREVGAWVPNRVDSGCAGEVAATVHARWVGEGGVVAPAPSMNRCLRVDRDAVAAVRPSQPMVHAGEVLKVRLLGAKGSASIVLEGPGGGAWRSAWLADGRQEAKVTLPTTAQGQWTLTAAGLAATKDKNVLDGRVLVLPRVLPRLTAKREKPDDLPPGGQAVLEAVLDDGHGQPLLGSVGAVVFDKTGGTHPERLLALDTRRSLAASAGIAEQDTEAFLDGDNAFEIERWAAVARGASVAAPPAFDPVSSVDQQIEGAFREIVQSLEGAVHEASGNLERLRDARVRTRTGFALNPELLTLVTEAMAEPPLTPGGEPWRLSDLMAIDKQVRFDTAPGG